MKSKILIVDDEPIARDTLAALLHHEGYDLSFARNGLECLSRTQDLLPDLILLDVMMPGMDGFETCRTIRSNPKTSKTPIVLVTALDDEKSRLEGFRAGADDFISKPFNRVELLTRVRTITTLNRNQTLLQERARFESLVRLSPNGVIVIDEDGRVLMLNPAAQILLDCGAALNRESVQFCAYLPENQRSAFLDVLRHAIRNMVDSLHLELDIQRPNGETIPIEMNISPLVWENSPAAQVIFQDISQRKISEKALKQQVARQTRELAALYAAAMLPEGIPDVRAVLPLLLEKVLQAIHAESGLIYLLDKKGEGLELASTIGIVDEERERVARRVLDNEKVKMWLDGQISSTGMQLDAVISDIGGEFRQWNNPSCLGAVIRSKAQVLGMLGILRAQPSGFPAEDAFFISTIADQIGIVLENDRLRKVGEKAVIVEERQRLARDLHDSVAQSVFSLTLFAQAGRDALTDNDIERVSETLARIQDNADRALKEMRLLVFELLPSEVEEGGLVQAVKKRLDSVERRAGIETDIEVDWEGDMLISVQDQLYRIVLEALNNSLRHARAKSVRVVLHNNERGLFVSVVDDGVGFDAVKIDQGGMGLRTMQQRARTLHAVLTVRSTQGKGTEVRCAIPRNREETGAEIHYPY